MHNLEFIKNHVEVARGYLLEQYKHRPKLNALIASLIEPIQDIENKLYELYDNYSLAHAQGHYLDRIGTLVGEARSYRPDDDYRLAILARIMINNGGGAPEDIISALRFTFKPEKLSYTELYPACFSVFIQGSCINASSKGLIKSIKPAGISDFIIVYTAEENPFIFAECTSEDVIFIIKETVEDNNSTAEVNTGTNTRIKKRDFVVASDVLFFPEGHPGFGEIIVTKTNLSLNDNELYFIDENDPLEMLLAYEDFIISGGSKLAEVIENG